MLASALHELGAVVTTATSGFEAEKLLEQKSFDILVSDIAMPELDGYELVRRIRERERSQGKALTERIPAIALTTLIGTTDRLRALSAGFQMHVPKPIEMSELVIVIASLIRSDKTKDSRA